MILAKQLPICLGGSNPRSVSIMKGNTILTSLILICCILFRCSTANDKGTLPSVRIVGAMRNVMWKGQLSGSIIIDTIANKRNLYGLGPVEYLSGELMILDGKAYKSSVRADSTLMVEETFSAKAPFFVYANVAHWKESALPDSVQSGIQLEAYLNLIKQSQHEPFCFKLNGILSLARIHIVNLPQGATVSSPTEACSVLK
jgi:acetolactate decarboxylase